MRSAPRWPTRATPLRRGSDRLGDVLIPQSRAYVFLDAVDADARIEPELVADEPMA